MKFATRALHTGQASDRQTGSVIVPIYQTSTYEQDGVDRPRGGYEYARTQNPTRTALETTLASVENGAHGICYASGSAATAAVLDLLQPGDEVVSTIDVYGGTWRQLRMVFDKYDIRSTFLDAHDAATVTGAITDDTRMILIETPTNPMLNVIDIAEVAKGRRDDILLVVDNTFATPWGQNPLDLGADIVLHSTTKYVGGHSDAVGGALAMNDDELARRCRFYQNAVGAVPGPFDCFLMQRGLKTLEIRMERHSQNAMAVAEYLSGHDVVEAVHFPGLPDHPHHALARAQMRGFGGMVSFTIRGGRPAADRFFAGLELWMLAESLGGVESLVCYPTRMTHHAIPEDEKAKIGVTDSLVRLSVGIEDASDLVEDLDRALRKV